VILSRRDLLVFLGAGAGFLRPGRRVALAQAPGWQAAKSSVTFPTGAVIRTVLKDVPPDALRGGATMMHEHLVGVGSYSSPPPPTACPMPCSPPVAGPVIEGADLLVEELKATAADGVTCIVNSTIALPSIGGVMFGKAFIDVDEWRDKTRRHRYVHGGFENSHLRFSIYLPPKRAVQATVPAGPREWPGRPGPDDDRCRLGVGVQPRVRRPRRISD
jgi:hypothetical protein